MSTVQGLRAGISAGILIGMTLAAGTVRAQGNFTTERPSSVLIFPKVVNTLGDTIIQISNTNNRVTFAHCFYTDGRQVNGVPSWQVTDFELILTRQQPTHWSVSDGRAVDPTDFKYVQTAGLDPGLIPPVPPGFTGFLLCVETAADGTPVSANSLKGEATVGQEAPFGVSKYNAIGIPACVSPQGPCGASGRANDGDDVLSLDGHEYAACPGGMYLNFIAENASDPAIDETPNIPSVVSTSLTLVPCGMDFQNLVPTSTAFHVDIRNEFENNLSVNSVPLSCWFNETLGGPDFGPPFVMTLSGMGTTFGKAILRPLADSGLPPVVGVANVLRTAGDGSSDTAASNLPFCTEESAPSLCVPFDSEIRLPPSF
jgi:hypothetical protein